MLTDVALFLHSTIWMHYLLQKLEGQLIHHIPVRLHKPLLHSGGGEVVVYPDFVHKVVTPPLGADKFQPLYDSITLSRYLIHLKHFQALKREPVSQLEPVGDPHSQPGVLRDLAAAIHDILHGLVDLHKQGYTHPQGSYTYK
jgi:hypothetical protein